MQATIDDFNILDNGYKILNINLGIFELGREVWGNGMMTSYEGRHQGSNLDILPTGCTMV